MTVTGGHLHPQVSAASGGDCSTSQADSASSILVTRSSVEPQVSGMRYITLPRAAGRRPGVARMAQIMKVQAAYSDRGHRLRPARLPVEVTAPQRRALRPREHQMTRAGRVKTARGSRTSGRITPGMPTTRRPARDFGGPRTICPVDRSAKDVRTRTAPLSTSRSHLRSAITSPHHRLANVARSTSTR
jgi:hypothetical protein